MCVFSFNKIFRLRFESEYDVPYAQDNLVSATLVFYADYFLCRKDRKAFRAEHFSQYEPFVYGVLDTDLLCHQVVYPDNFASLPNDLGHMIG